MVNEDAVGYVLVGVISFVAARSWRAWILTAPPKGKHGDVVLL